jgi:LacI family transcriptional regulator
MAVSIADVARRAKVSISTVSRVLNRRDLVNAQTRARVEAAIQELGYQPNTFARGLMLRRSDVVGLVLPDLHGEFYSEIIRGANSRARELGYNLVIASAHDPDDMRALLAGIHGRALLDGVAVMIAEHTDPLEDVLRTLQTPFVLIDGELEGGHQDRVVIDQHAGALAMMRHLLDDCAMRRVFFVGGLATNMDTIARQAAYASALRAADLPRADDDVIYLDYRYETAYTWAIAHLRGWVGEKHCIFAANDEMASGIVNAATAQGIQVPSELAVVGFDDTRIARMTHPSLTTVRVPMAQMGATAIDLLGKRLLDAEAAPTRVSLQPDLVVRNSCGCLHR